MTGRESVSIEAPVDQVWQHLLSGAGAEALLRPGAVPGSHSPGAGSGPGDDEPGQTRAWEIRLSSRPAQGGPAGLVDVILRPDGGGTRLELVHRGMGDPAAWHDLLGRLRSSLDATRRDPGLVGSSPRQKTPPDLTDGLEARRRRLLASLDALGPLDRDAV